MSLAYLDEQLEDLKKHDLYRSMRTVEGIQDAEATLDGRRVVMLSSNNYLGLAGHPRLAEASARASLEYGAGSGSSRLISGNLSIYGRLERALAELKSCEAALLFSTGYMANMGVLQSLVGQGDAILSDELNHASLIDGCRLSRARALVYRHLDLDHLEERLREARSAPRRLIVTDSLFSMDGDLAPLPEMVDLARRYDALLMIDEAHATGVLGRTGRGAIEHFGLEGKIDVVMGTLGKALGSFGAFIAGEKRLVEFLVNRCRTFIFTTAMPPAAAAASLAAVELLLENPELPARLRRNTKHLRRAVKDLGYDLGPAAPESPIIPVLVGEAGPTMRLAGGLLERGVFAHGIRPPTVPVGTSRIRTALMATHTPEMLDRAAAAFAEAGRELGLIPGATRAGGAPKEAAPRLSP